MSTESPIRLAAGRDRLHGVLHAAEGRPRGAVLFCSPIFEERKSAQRAMVETARALAADGWIVLRFDYRGCGDSTGAFAAFSLDEWRSDIRLAAHTLRERAPAGPIGLLGLRLGATLALQTATKLAGTDFLVLWEPIVNGRAYLEQELRRKLMKEMLTFGRSHGSRTEMLSDLDQARSVDFDGYAVSPALNRDLGAVALPGPLPGLPRHILICRVGPPSRPDLQLQTLREALAAAGVATESADVNAPPFWSRIGLTDTTALTSATARWLRTTVGETGSAAPPGQPARPVPPVEAGVEDELPAEFSVADARLRGVLHVPRTSSARKTGIVFLHGWTGCRLGPHRMFVTTARGLAAQGFACLRFDFRGRGESDGTPAGATIASMIEDARAAADYLRTQASVDRLILLGICSGGKVAVAFAAQDPRVNGLALWSAEPLGERHAGAATRRKTLFALRDYAAKALNPQVWRRLFAGRLNLRLVRKAVLEHEGPDASERARESAWLASFRRFRGRILFVYGSNDPATKSAAERYQRFCEEHRIPHAFHSIDGANHSFYSIEWERRVIGLTSDWLCGWERP